MDTNKWMHRSLCRWVNARTIFTAVLDIQSSHLFWHSIRSGTGHYWWAQLWLGDVLQIASLLCSILLFVRNSHGSGGKGDSNCKWLKLWLGMIASMFHLTFSILEHPLANYIVCFGSSTTVHWLWMTWYLLAVQHWIDKSNKFQCHESIAAA